MCLRVCILLSLVMMACDPSSGPTDGGQNPDDAAAQPDRAPIDVGQDEGDDRVDARDPADGGVVLARVSHEREMRGVWIATVANINWPSRQGLDAATQQQELDRLFDKAAELRLNAVFFQIRAEADAFYRSDLEPWSRFLTGTQGQDPGYDPLTYAIAAAHERGLELHAWLNPYRAATNRSVPLADNHVSETISSGVVEYGSFYWLDPGSSEAEAHTLAVVADVLTRYDIDGLHFDDHFYPYPNGDPFPDNLSYGRYQDAGGTLDRGDYRRDNVNRMVRSIGELVASTKPDVRFGISPFGIYRPGMPAGIRGLDQYAEIYADPVEWMQRGWVDYLAPQLYWPSTRTAQAYAPLCEWWAALATDGRSVWAGNYLSKLGTEAEWTLDELGRQMNITRASTMTGNIFFQIEPFMQNTLGVNDLFGDEVYPSHVETPPAANAPTRIGPPEVSLEGTTLSVRSSRPTRSYAIYQDIAGRLDLQQLLPAFSGSATLSLSAGRWAISRVDRRGAESAGVVIQVE